MKATGTSTTKRRRADKKIAILALGDMQELGSQVAEELNAALYNPLSANILDTDCLDHLAWHYQAVITLENNILDGASGKRWPATWLTDRFWSKLLAKSGNTPTLTKAMTRSWSATN